MLLVVGSTGLLGSEIVRQCEGPVRAMVRPTANAERLRALHAAGVEVTLGDLKEPDSLRAACRGVDAVISTASSTLSRQAGDDIESVDRHGQIALVEAARQSGVRHFTFFGIEPVYGDSPLTAAKRAFEEAVLGSGMEWTNLAGNCFMEVWLSAALGFDTAARRVTLWGGGDGLNSWVSAMDIAKAAARAHRTPEAAGRKFHAAGPEALSLNDVTAIFEKAAGAPFERTVVPMEALEAQALGATDPLQKTFAELQLACARGVRMDPGPFASTFGLSLTSVRQYAARVCSGPQ